MHVKGSSGVGLLSLQHRPLRHIIRKDSSARKFALPHSIPRCTRFPLCGLWRLPNNRRIKRLKQKAVLRSLFLGKLSFPSILFLPNTTSCRHCDVCIAFYPPLGWEAPNEHCLINTDGTPISGSDIWEHGAGLKLMIDSPNDTDWILNLVKYRFFQHLVTIMRHAA